MIAIAAAMAKLMPACNDKEICPVPNRDLEKSSYPQALTWYLRIADAVSTDAAGLYAQLQCPSRAGPAVPHILSHGRLYRRRPAGILGGGMESRSPPHCGLQVTLAYREPNLRS